MSDFTIEQPEALKDGATPGPWEWYWDQGIISLRGAGGEPIAMDLTVADADMIAAAPALVDALIAEKQARQETLHLVRELWSDVHHHGNVGRASILRHLTRILEATND